MIASPYASVEDFVKQRMTAIKNLEPRLLAQFPQEEFFWQSLEVVVRGSDFIADSILSHPHLFVELLSSNLLDGKITKKQYERLLMQQLEAVSGSAELAILLRQFRRKHMIRIAWRDLLGLSSYHETVENLTSLADACIIQTLNYLQTEYGQKYGFPKDEQGNIQRMIVLAVGKLGGEELNFSSDIDLIFAYPDFSAQKFEKKYTHVEEYFTQMGRSFIQLLSEVTEDGFVFRVDMRLRPYGESGPLVSSISALENYYQEQGREWERYALIKARVVFGGPKDARTLMQMLRPFIYRRYIDYGVIAALRALKALIEREMKLKNMQEDIKLGRGGIRQVEFIGQAFQLVRGGKEPVFQQRSILPVLSLLSTQKLVSKRLCQKLIDAYIFLRNVEHRLQMFKDQQTQKLPTSKFERSRLAHTMGFKKWDHFYAVLERHRDTISNLFEVISAGPQEHESHQKNDLFKGQGIWWEEYEASGALTALTRIGYQDPQQAYTLIMQFKHSKKINSFTRRGLSRLDNLMPTLISLAGRSIAPEIALQRLLMLVESIGKRSAYLSLLSENTAILKLLCELFVKSQWIATQLCQYPVLLDEFIDTRKMHLPIANKKMLQEELSHRLKWFEDDDLENQMECLRQFKLANVMKIAVADISGQLPLKRVSDHLTDIAETILEKSMQLIWHHLVQRYGTPQKAPGVPSPCEFIILGYGKLGGIELGYASDLDLVFLYSGNQEGSTSGERVITNEEFYIRFGQRVFHLLNTSTLSGALYSVDMRLRPLGDSGLLVTSLEAFSEYQRKDAWTWEHQALVRARVIAGDVSIKQKFESLRKEILQRKRDPIELKQAIQDMRSRMLSGKKKEIGDVFDVKLDPGGMGDIEFIVQYAVLRFAHEHPILIEYSDNMRILDSMVATEVISLEDANLLRQAYLAYRNILHQASLHEETGHNTVQFKFLRENVVKIWNKIMEKSE